MRKYLTRIIYQLIGIFFYALGIIFAVKSNMGYARGMCSMPVL